MAFYNKEMASLRSAHPDMTYEDRKALAVGNVRAIMMEHEGQGGFHSLVFLSQFKNYCPYMMSNAVCGSEVEI